MKKKFTLAYSTCPNDTFIFNAMVNGLIHEEGISFDVTLEDVETLNLRALKGEFDITKLSFAAFGVLRDKYALLKSGAAIGRGCGPLVVAPWGKSLRWENKRPSVAVPGMGTTAFVLFTLFIKDMFPDIEPGITAIPFEKIMPSVMAGEYDLGVVIHEGRFIYKNMGLDALVDLGQWWEEMSGLPIPLGCIAVKRELGSGIALKVENLIRKSIAHAWRNPDLAMPYIREHAQELDESVIREHIKLYVNEFSMDMGDEGERAVHALYEKGERAGIMPKNKLPLFAHGG
ncbi:MAG: 1,4-dihydroxy-6-naphthoate synthase [Desulfamplus sp.]|nr:1,4-dihydroxy-6-naphthoate synthase [Desulfamplus sp.]